MTARRALVARLSLALVVGLAPLALTAPLLARATAQDAKPAVTGSRLDIVQGVSILTLEGTSHEQGRAHGRLLAQPIVDLVGAFEKVRTNPKKFPTPEAFHERLAKYRWDADEREELDGMLEGIHDTLGKDVEVPGAKRALVREDLDWINVLSDVLPLACSSFTVSGDRVEGGKTLTARNLDYAPLPILLASRLVIVHRAHGQALGWATVGWPGLLGCYTGMNADGVTASLHDVPTSKDWLKGEGFTARSLGLRAILERTAGGEKLFERAAATLRTLHTSYGGNLHLSAPALKGSPVAAVLEWDPDTSREGGVTVRVSEAGPLLCTNHFRSRTEPKACDRYEALAKFLEDPTKKLTLETAFEGLKVGPVGLRPEKNAPIALHSVVFCPEDRSLLVAFAAAKDKPAPFEAPVKLDLGSLIAAARAPK